MSLELQIVSALLLDSILGDPSWLPHPVRLIGRLAEWSETHCRKLFASGKAAGILTVILVLSATGAGGWGMLHLAGIVHPWAKDVVSIYLLYACFAARDLLAHSSRVAAALVENDPARARIMVGMIVGRDTAGLEEEGVVRACVESVAENTVDGVTAPLFWAAVGGPLGALLYKAVSTMDSMFGYTSEQYLHFGWAPARLDDLVNWLPARITGLLLVLAALILRMHPAAAWRVFLRDRLNHASPNSGHPEAAVAGALGIRLGGLSTYFGKPVQKPVIGDDCCPPHAGHIKQVQDLLIAATVLALIFFIFVRMAFSAVVR
ncbi:MAG: adenosylcobinamide-phosphate synthase CbiB [Desulfobulbaceae bacterium]|nr:adenosylcobinamide-phosphate synthase CbiB [Desulfobulbaceae bacterium]